MVSFFFKEWEFLCAEVRPKESLCNLRTNSCMGLNIIAIDGSGIVALEQTLAVHDFEPKLCLWIMQCARTGLVSIVS
jgi:hypothetical protein